MIEVIARERAAVLKLCERHHVSMLSIFGSATREDFDPESSDIDLLVEFHPSADPTYARNYREFREALERTLGKRVDLLSFQAIKNPYLRRSIEANRIQLYAA